MGKGKRNRTFRNVIGIKPRTIPKRPDRPHRTPAQVQTAIERYAAKQRPQANPAEARRGRR